MSTAESTKVVLMTVIQHDHCINIGDEPTVLSITEWNSSGE